MSDTPQFSTAQYAPKVAGDTCRACKLPISGVHYVANGSMLCGSCGESLRRQIPQDSHAAFVRGIVFGLGGFAVGLALYAGFVIVTDIQIGFVSLAVGWLVAKAMMIGSKGAGGRRYQIAAAILTYAAVSMAFIPIAIHYQIKNRPAEMKPSSAADASTGQPQEAQGKDPGPAPASAPAQADGDASKKAKPSLAGFVGWLAIVGLASPFFLLRTGAPGVIGLIILLVGMRFAWRMTRGVQVTIEGPYGSPAKA